MVSINTKGLWVFMFMVVPTNWNLWGIQIQDYLCRVWIWCVAKKGRDSWIGRFFLWMPLCSFLWWAFLYWALVMSSHMVRVEGVVQVSYLVPIVIVTQVLFKFQKEEMAIRTAIPQCLVLKATRTGQYIFSWKHNHMCLLERGGHF
jgi:hypothetical protein